MRIAKGSIDYIVNKLKSGQHFSFTRYGDGEWNAIKGKRGCNCDKHEYFPEMGLRLKHTLSKPIIDPNYIYGWQTETDLLGRSDVQEAIRTYLNRATLYDADVFHRASEAGELFPLIEQLRKMKTIIIGPERMCNKKLLGCNANSLEKFYIRIPEKNCYKETEKIIEQITGNSVGWYFEDFVFCFSASMATEILMYDLWPILGKNNWMIDFGSLWEPYIGNNNRKYHSRISKETINKNLGL